MSRYDQLRQHLAAMVGQIDARLTFTEIEQLVGPLPRSARTHRAWWANDSKAEAVAWREAGWHVARCDLTHEWVIFEPGRVGGSRTGQQHRGQLIDNVGRPEADVQADVVRHLKANGWTIVRQANTASKQAGIDVVATIDGRTVAIEVKGFPDRTYADPRRADELKPSSPATQARHWYAHAVLSAILTRNTHPEWESVIALPDGKTYSALIARTHDNLAVIGIRQWRVTADGAVGEWPR